jgi:hypothetical protein
MLRQVELDAEIVPGRSAAGFSLGEQLANVEPELPGLSDWRAEEQSLAEAISSTEHWLRAKIFSAQGDLRGTFLVFGGGVVELWFPVHGTLCEIRLFKGYRGKVLGSVAVDDPLESVMAQCPLSYDNADEMYYPDENTTTKGLAFIAPSPGDDEAEMKVLGISVHDWRLLDDERRI